MSTKYEYYSAGDDDAMGIGRIDPPSTQWYTAQTFTPSTTHYIDYVKLKLYRLGNPYRIVVVITGTENIGGVDIPHLTDVKSRAYLLCDSITTNTAGDWYTATFGIAGSGYGLTQVVASTAYAIVCYQEVLAIPSTTNYIAWKVDASAASYANGYGEWLYTGLSWSYAPATDFMFEEWGSLTLTDTSDIDIPVSSAILRPRPLQKVIAGHIIDLPLNDISCAPKALAGYYYGITLPCSTATATPLKIEIDRGTVHQIYAKPEYFAMPTKINRVYVIGIDTSDRMVYGEAKDGTINGEELRTNPDSMITSTADANTVAANILAKERLNVLRGQFPAIPNCGLEVYDPVSLTDSSANQTAASYRVAGWNYEFDSHKGTNLQTIKLTSL